MREQARSLAQRLLFILLFSFFYWESHLVEPVLARFGFEPGSLAYALAIATGSWILASIILRLVR